MGRFGLWLLNDIWCFSSQDLQVVSNPVTPVYMPFTWFGAGTTRFLGDNNDQTMVINHNITKSWEPILQVGGKKREGDTVTLRSK